MPIFTSFASLSCAVRVEDLIEPRLLGLFDVDDRQALLAGRDIGVGAGDVDVARVFERHQRVRTRAWAERGR